VIIIRKPFIANELRGFNPLPRQFEHWQRAT